MTSINAMMEQRAALTRQMDTVPIDVSTDKAFNEIFERRWALEKEILSRQATTLDELQAQHRVLAARAADGADVSADLARLSTTA